MKKISDFVDELGYLEIKIYIVNGNKGINIEL